MMDLYILIGFLYSLVTSPITARDSYDKEYQVMYIAIVSLTKALLWPLAALSWALTTSTECYRCGCRDTHVRTVTNEYGKIRMFICKRCGSVKETR